MAWNTCKSFEFCLRAGLHIAGPGICHWYLTMTRHPETNVNLEALNKYIFRNEFARSNLSHWVAFVSIG